VQLGSALRLPYDDGQQKAHREESAMRNNIAFITAAALAALALTVATVAVAQAPQTPPPAAALMAPGLPPTMVIDLMTTDGAARLGAQWRVSDVTIKEVPIIQGVITQNKMTYDIDPHAGGTDFDDSKWPVIEPKDLNARRSGGHVAFMWYRAMLTIPPKIGELDTAGAVAVFHTTVDDYAEIWVNGVIPGRSGYPRPAAIAGHNMPNRVVLSPSLKAGDKFQIAIFGINGPISMAPANSVFVRDARLELFK
jgi:gluconolactonase